MKMLFTFAFEGHKKTFNRKYTFDTLFENKSSYEKTLDWAETTEDIAVFKDRMDKKYGYSRVTYNPCNELYGLTSSHISHENYISIIEDWKAFLTQHRVKCGKIVEIIEDRAL